MALEYPRRILCTILIFILYLAAGQHQICLADNISFSPVFPRNEYFADRLAVDLLHDSRGYLWIGTYDGLLRYDGSSFRYFTRVDLHTESSAISNLFEDSRGNVWIGTEGGLSRYNVETGTFVGVNTSSDDEAERIDTKVGCIREGRDGLIWFTLKSKGIWSFNPLNGEFRHFLYDLSGKTPAPKINTFVIDSSGSFIISEYCSGLYICRDGFTSVEPISVPGLEITGDNIPCLLPGERNSVYAGSTTYGLCEIFPYTGKASVLIPIEKGVQPTGLAIDGETGRLYMATTSGIWSLGLTDGATECYRLSNTFGLPSDSFSCVGVSRSGALLAGLGSGNIYFSSLQDDFIRKYASLSDGTPLKGLRMRRFGEDTDGNIWILTSSGGLLSLGKSSGILDKVKLQGVPEHCEDLCFAGGRLYLSSGSCLYNVDLRSGRCEKLTPEFLEAEWLIDRPIYPIFPSGEQLFLGTALGVVTYNPETRTVGHLPGLEECNVNGFSRDADTLLISTYAHGLVRYDLHSQKIIPHTDERHLLSLTGRRLNGVQKDDFGRVWVATGESGVAVLEPGEAVKMLNSGSTFGALKSDNVRSIVMDYSGTVWAATENGLTSISSDLSAYEHYSEADGLLNNSFLSRSAFASTDGTLYFGGRDGFISFRPDKLRKTRRQTPALYVDELRVNNSPLMAGDGGELSRNIELTEKLSFSYKRNSLSFTFSRPALPSSSDGYIACRMKGLDREWVRLAPDNVFSCRELSPGKYELLARSYSSSGELEAEHRPIEIVIRPPLWRSTAAIVLYILIALGGLSCGGFYLWRKLKREEEERYRRFTEEKLELTPERKMLRAAQIGQSPSAFLRPDLAEGERKFISKLDAAIEKNIADEKLTYGMVAELLCIGKQSLNLKVKSLLGVTVSNYILLYRLFASVPLLSEDDSRVNVVCFKVGFNTPSYFAKCFKNAFGMLPGEFKEM